MTFQYANIPVGEEVTPAPGRAFKLKASAPTDIWRKPPSLDVFSAPLLYQALPISSFKGASVTATGQWKTLYDQGGLVLVLPAKKGLPGQKRWVKAGIEFYQNKPCMSVVAADEWADWSLSGLSAEDEARGIMRVEMEREVEKDGSYGPVLQLLLVDGNGGKMPIREITWAFHDLDEKEEIWVGVYAAKPTKDDREALEVEFTDFVIETRD